MLKVHQNAGAVVEQPAPAVPARPAAVTRRTPQHTGGWRSRYVHNLRWIDGLAILVTLVVTQLVRFRLEDAGLHLGDDVSVPYWIVGAVLGLAWWFFLELRGARDVRLIGYGMEETRQVVSSTLVLFGAVAIISFAFDLPTARSYVLIALPLGIGLLVLGRFVLRDRLVKDRVHGKSLSRTMIVGRVPAVIELLNSLHGNPTAGLDAAAVYAPAPKHPLSLEFQRVPLPPNALPPGERPSVEGVIDACRALGIETVVLSANVPLSTREIRQLSWLLTDERIRLIMDTGLTDIAGPRIHMQQVTGPSLPLIHVATPRMSRGGALVKRSMDVLGAASALLLFSPVIAAVAFIIKAHDGGPVFFAHERIGVDGRKFKVLKFRTMRTDAEERKAELLAEAGGKALLFKVKDDPRITKPGKWMRRFSLDELPQFINVLKGEMSLVGPRPQVQAEVDEYDVYMHRRLRVKPGITGLWQVSGRSNLSLEQSIRLDLYYVENWSPVQDMLILIRTFKAVVAKEGAY